MWPRNSNVCGAFRLDCAVGLFYRSAARCLREGAADAAWHLAKQGHPKEAELSLDGTKSGGSDHDLGDLQARLGLSAKSRRAVEREKEEEERRRREEDEKQRAEEEARERQEREKAARASAADPWSLAGKPVQPSWVHEHIEDHEADKLTAPPKAGHRARVIVRIGLGVLSGLVVLFSGYFLGQAFAGRANENAKIDEAKGILKFFEDRKELIDLITQHRQDIDDILGLFDAQQTQNRDPKWIVEKLTEFAVKCNTFVTRVPQMSLRNIFQSAIYDNESVAEVATFVESVNEFIDVTRTFLLEREVLLYLNQQFGAAEPKPIPRHIVIDAAPDAPPAPAAPPDGSAPAAEPAADTKPWRTAKLVKAMTPLQEVQNEAGQVTGYQVEVSLEGVKESVTVDVKDVVEFDGQPLAKLESQATVAMLADRVKTHLLGLKEAAGKVNLAPVQKKLQEKAAKDYYFTF